MEGTIAHIIVPAGAPVKKGQPLAALHNIEQRKQYQLAQHAAAIARTQLKRTEKLYASRFASKKVLEDKRNAFITAEQALATSKHERDKTIISSPFDGVVGIFKAREGDHVSIGDPIVTIVQPSAMQLEFNVPEPLLPKLKPGSKIAINNHLGTIKTVQQCLDAVTHMAPAIAEITCQDCISGTSVYVDVILDEHPAALTIPYEAIFLKDAKPCVYEVEKGKAVLCPLTLGIQNKDRIEILSGLKEGKMIVLRGQERLYDGCPIQILKD
jgi:membrane fusion protein (multidrug efflux system)